MHRREGHMDLGLFKGWDRIVAVVVETVVFYWYALFLLRLAGKRTVATMTIFDFLSTVAMASIIAGTVISDSVALAEGIVALTTLVALQWTVAFLAARSERFHGLITNTPRLLYEDSRFLEKNLLDERVARSEVIAKIREAGHLSPSSVHSVVLETTGDVTVLSHGDVSSADLDDSVLREVRR